MEPLALGWYWSENKREWQLAKVAGEDRATHCYVVGATGSGKTKFLEYLIQQDIEQGNGFGVIDPHGDLIEDVKGVLAIAAHRGHNPDLLNRVVLVDPTDPEQTVTFNPLERIPGASAAEQAQELVSAFAKVWSDSWGVRMEDLLRHSLIALSEADFSLVELVPFLSEDSFRKEILRQVRHPLVQEYFGRFNLLTPRARVTWTEPVLNKLHALLADERLRVLFGGRRSSFNLRQVMDQQQGLLVKLDKGRLKDSADLLGSLVLAYTTLAAFSRSALLPSQRTPFTIYIDEFQNFASDTFAVLLSEARKYGLQLVLAHQTLAQLSSSLKGVILANTGLQVTFRVSRQDAEVLAKEAFEYSGYDVKTMHNFRPQFWSLGEEWEHHMAALQTLTPRQAYVKHKLEGGLIPIKTVDIPYPWTELGMDELAYHDYLTQLPIGQPYLRRRADLMAAAMPEVAPQAPVDSDEERLLTLLMEQPDLTVSAIYRSLGVSVRKGNSLRDRLKEQGLLIELETRLGQGGRVAKFLIPTFAAFTQVGQEPPGGRGGPLHRFLQWLIAGQAEVKGYRAECEHTLPSGGIVDVHLAKGAEHVAVEVAITSTVERELDHIEHCLIAGYGRIVVVCHNERLGEQLTAALPARLNGRGGAVEVRPVRLLTGVV
jgi:hypothetical protein